MGVAAGWVRNRIVVFGDGLDPEGVRLWAEGPAGIRGARAITTAGRADWVALEFLTPRRQADWRQLFAALCEAFPGIEDYV